MAGMILAPDIATQLRLVGWLRWRMFINGLRIAGRKLELAIKIGMGAGIAIGVLVWGPLLGLGCWFALSHHKLFIIPIELWVVFAVWLVLPVLVTGFGAEADPVSLLRFPLRYSTFVLLAFAHGIFDPVAVAAIYWLACMAVGVAVASPVALLNLLLNRSIFAWLSRWFAQRRTREILGVLFVLAMISLQLVGPLSQRYGKRAMPLLTRLAPLESVLPPGMAAAITLGIQLPVMGLAVGPFVLSHWAGHLEWCGAAYLVLVVSTWIGYRRVLNLTSDIAWKRRETLIAELARAE